jgi:hypothetical protein
VPLLRFEYVASVVVMPPLITWTLSVSYAVVVVVSLLLILSQNDSVALDLPAGIATDCWTESVCDVPYPSSQATYAPVRGWALLPVLMTPAVCVHAATPDSNPGFCSRFDPPPPRSLRRSELVSFHQPILTARTGYPRMQAAGDVVQGV